MSGGKAGRSERIRTSDPLNPIQVRYQAALRSDCVTSRGRTLSVQQENRRESFIVGRRLPAYASGAEHSRGDAVMFTR